MSFSSIRYKAYGAYAANVFDDHAATPTTPSEIPTKPPVPVKPPRPGFPGGFPPGGSDDHNQPPHLPPGCDFVKPNSFKFTKNGKSATGSTCEIAQINWNVKYGNPDPRPEPRPRPFPFPVPVPIFHPPHRIGDCIEDDGRWIFKGLVRCSNSRKRGCSREVVGRDCTEAKKNFCKLYGPNGRCNGDPRFTPQDPRDFHMDSDRSIVIKIIDDDLPDAIPVQVDDQEQQQAAVNNINITNPITPPAPGPAAGGMDFSSILSGTTAGIPNIMLAGGVGALILLLAVIKK